MIFVAEAAEEVRRLSGQPFWQIGIEFGVPYSDLMRWRQRLHAREPMLKRPGPAKVEELEIEKLIDDILALAFREKRTGGTGALLEKYADQMPRRELQEIVNTIRRERARQRRASKCRIRWLAPGLVWSVDDMKVEGRSVSHVRDLGSECTISVLGGNQLADGMQVAGVMEGLFARHGAPLFLKRDNGGNLNHQAVNAVLARWYVIPLNSPPHYAPYNGGIEHGQGEIKRGIRLLIDPVKATDTEFRLAAQLAGHERNHYQRRILGGQTACRVFSALGPRNRRKYDRFRRKEVFEQIKGIAVDIAALLGEDQRGSAETAWRYAVEQWMQRNNVIRVARKGEVLPYYHRLLTH
jgi:hypothetical protein